jgi:CubicO group peptidase (beta-lactamase class C family)
MISARACTLLVAGVALPFTLTAQSPAAPDSAAAVDAVFASWTSSSTPGCAVGVGRDGRVMLTRGYGLANLEHDVPITPATIFEAGSVSKQFTAAAVVLLMLDGKLSLEDKVRKYIPELPPYGDSISIRQMLNHTSGLRDWGTVAAAAGWPRGTRTYTHVHVLDIIARQRSLNYRPGAEYLYSNSNYNLAAMIVERVSGQSLQAFTRARLFQPLGMSNTSWRDEYRRIVKNRATAYAGNANVGFRQDMPFENVYGNSSLLTTVEDLLKWNRNFTDPVVGGPRFVAEMETQGRLNNGRTLTYALGLERDTWRGVRVVSHGGATAGYRAYLARYPDQRLDVAVLCNVGSANPGALNDRVAGIFLAKQLQPAAPQAIATFQPPVATLRGHAGLFRDDLTGVPVRLTLQDSTLRVGPQALVPVGSRAYMVGTTRVEFSDDARHLRRIFPDGDTVRLTRVSEWTPTPAELQEYVGRYASDEAETWYTIAFANGRLVRTGRYGETANLDPAYKDAFFQGGVIATFRRDARGRVVALTLGLGRVRELRFDRQ